MRVIAGGATGQDASFGPVVSVTVITAGIDEVWPAASLAVNVIVVDPTGNFTGAAGLSVIVAGAPVASMAVAARSIAGTVTEPGPTPSTVWSPGIFVKCTGDESDAVTRVVHIPRLPDGSVAVRTTSTFASAASVVDHAGACVT